MSVTERTHEEKGKVPLVGVKSRKHKVDLTHQRYRFHWKRPGAPSDERAKIMNDNFFTKLK